MKISGTRPTSRGIDGALSALTAALLVLCTGMAGWGLLSPSQKNDPAPFASITPTQPVRLKVPSLKINARIDPIELSADAELDPPSNPLEVGWWDASALPGADSGQTVITGHTVHTGGGAMDDIGQLRSGATVDVITKAGTMRYRVDGTAVLSKADVAKYAQNLFAQDRGDGRLILITCTDWNGSYYESNVVALALPLGQPTGKV